MTDKIKLQGDTIDNFNDKPNIKAETKASQELYKRFKNNKPLNFDLINTLADEGVL